MSIAKAISNAMSGLTATARGTETVASNLSNVMTPGFARREMAVGAQLQGGGVRVDGINRVINASLLSEQRLAASAVGDISTQAAYHKSMEKVVGLPGEPQALSTALSAFQTALSAAASRPDDEIRLSQVLSGATALADRLNAASGAVQAARSTAQQGIASDVGALNTALERVAYLNTRISVMEADGRDTTALMDERQQNVDRISAIVPVQEVARAAGKIALFTAEGAVLLDGSRPAQLQFTGGAQVTADQVAGAPLPYLTLNGTELSAAQMRLFGGGALAANFQIRDSLAPQLQADLDDIAYDLHQRLADPAVDPTLAATDPGLFTDAGLRADSANRTGLAGRLSVNAAVDPNRGGQLWRLRTGLAAPTGQPVGQSALLIATSDAIAQVRPADPDGGFSGSGSLSQWLGTIEARVSTMRVNAEADLSIRNSRQSTIQASMMADGVDSDAEMQRLLQYEQSYAANARVLVAVDEMINQILRM